MFSISTKIECWKLKIPIAFLTGAMGTLAFSPYNIWPSAIVSCTSLLLLISISTKIGHNIWIGFSWGLGLFSTGVGWIYSSISRYSDLHVLINILFVVLLYIYLACYSMLFTFLLVTIWPRNNIYQLIYGAPVIWLLTDFLRSIIFTGFPWLQFGYSQIDGPLKFLAPISGVEAITFIIVMISGTFTIAIKRRTLSVLIPVLILIIIIPLCSLNWYELDPKKTISVALVQGNIDPIIKFNTKQIYINLNNYLNQTLPYINKAQIIIWPESAIIYNKMHQKKFFIKINKALCMNHTSLITGIIDIRPTLHRYKYYNTIIILDKSNNYNYSIYNRYDKHHLVPFGEKVPLESVLRPLSNLFNLPMSCLSQGNYLQSQLKTANIKFTATICYEIILGKQLRDNFCADTDFLLNISNNAWFGKSIAPWQYLQMARMRSLELGRPLLHSSNNGITAVVNADGTLKTQLPQFTSAVLYTKVTPTKGITPYVKVGLYPLWIIAIFISLFAIILDRR